MSQYFCMEGITAGEVGMTGKDVDGNVCEASDFIYPCWTVLPMGCSWSLYFAQCVTEKQLSDCEALAPSTLMSDHGPSLVISDKLGVQGHFG